MKSFFFRIKYLIWANVSFWIFLMPFSVFGQLDTNYIQVISNIKNFAFHSTLKKFSVNFSSNDGNTTTFENKNLGIGLRFQYKKIGVSMSVPVVNFKKSVLGKPLALGLGFNLYPKQFFVQGDFRFIKGFDQFMDNTTTVFRNDNKLISGSLIGNYIVNSEKFSLRSAFRMINQQKKSAGSWIVSVPVNVQLFSTDSLALRIGSTDLVIDNYQSIKVGLGGGYAYSYVSNHWSATLMTVGGVEFRRLKYRNSANQQFKDNFLISPRVRVLGSLIYNQDKFFGGFVGQYLPGLEATDGLNTRLENWRIRLVIGQRFL